MGKFNIVSDKFYGKYRAEVVDIDDPKKRGRILVKCETVLPKHSELGWAESCFMPGMFFLPKKGDFVWIEFEEGDINLPIWVGIMPTRGYVKSYLFDDFNDRVNYDPHVQIIRGKHHKIVLKGDDLKGVKSLEMRDDAGSTFTLNSNTGDVVIRAKDNYSVSSGGFNSHGQGESPTYDSPGTVKPIKPMESGD